MISEQAARHSSGEIANLDNDVTFENAAVSQGERETRNKHKAAVVWLTGLSAAGKSTISKHLERSLFDEGCNTALLDGDNLRNGLSKDLGFSDFDRTENIRRVGEVAKLFFDHGTIVVCAFISPLRSQRDEARSLLPESRFFEIFVSCSLQTCIERDPKGLYRKAIDGKTAEFTGISSPYEEPLKPELIVDTESQTVDTITKNILSALKSKEIIK